MQVMFQRTHYRSNYAQWIVLIYFTSGLVFVWGLGFGVWFGLVWFVIKMIAIILAVKGTDHPDSWIKGAPEA